MLGAIPAGITVLIANLFYSNQELYEVSLHNTWECAKISEMKQLKAEVSLHNTW